MIKYGNQACWPSQAGKSPCLVLTEAPCSICSAIPLPFPGQCLENLLMFFCKICVQSKKKGSRMLGWDGWDLRNQTEEPSTAETWQEQGKHEQNKGVLFFLTFVFSVWLKLVYLTFNGITVGFQTTECIFLNSWNSPKLKATNSNTQPAQTTQHSPVLKHLFCSHTWQHFVH